VTHSIVPTSYASFAPNYDLRAVVDANGAVLGTVRCRDVKANQTDTSSWLAFRGVPNTGLRDAGLGEFPTMTAAGNAVAASAG
jgi:hypothetical protein